MTPAWKMVMGKLAKVEKIGTLTYLQLPFLNWTLEGSAGTVCWNVEAYPEGIGLQTFNRVGE